jgi:cell surface protein SprA
MVLRLDYAANKKLSVGATIEHLTERPYFSKVNYGEDPISNTLFGTDFSYQSNWPGLTRALNKLPFYSTKAPSSVAASGEVAYFKPGQAPGTDGSIYVDDFEGTTSNIDLRFPLISWALASTPSRFPEATLISNLDYGKNRAKLAWYNIEPTLQDPNSSNNPLRSNLAELSDPRVRLVYTNELFPQTTTTITNTQTTTFDIAYYPTEIGPYNYESSPSQVDANGNLKNPKTRWGGLMRAIDQTDFETNNIDAVEFWVQDPFIKNPTSTGGTLYMDLGEVSEDILKDGKHLFENGLSTPNITAATDTSIWGKMPLNPVQVTNSFSNDASDRPYQDVGFDGLDDDSERVVRSDYLKSIQTVFGTNSPLYQRAINDPSNDDYVWYRDSKFDAAGAGILERYKNYNNPQGNSAIATGNNSSAATTYPDNEDINHDNIMNETEAYYEYAINLNPGMTAGTNQYISDERTISVTYADGHSGTEKWYQFRIPIKDYTDTVGQISDFKSIRFVRLYLSGFEDSVVCRFAEFNLVRSQWRQFNYYLDTTGSYTTIPNTTNTTFNTISVNLEENSSRTPVNYVIPPGINRVQTLNNNGVSVLENEQSLSLQISNLADGDARAVYKTVAMDFRQYGKLSMFAHAESVTGQTAVKDNELNLVVRIGQDYLSNYYEIKIPLKITAPGFYTTAQAGTVWPAANNLDFSLQELIDLKKRRNGISGQLITNIYREIIGNKTFSVMGNPNLGEVEGILIAVENAKDNNAAALSAEVWVDELRLSEVNNHGAYAALGKVDVTLADLGKLSVSGSTYSQGWGALDSHINDRLLENQHQFDAVLDIDAGKLLPKSARLSVPMYTSISRIVATPEYDPFDLDIKLSDKINAAKTKALKDSIKNAAFNQLTVKTINFTNVHILPKGKTHLWSLSNFNISYSLSKTTQSDSADAMNNLTKWRVILGYNYQNSSKFVQPFRKVIKSNNSWWTWLKDFNFNLKPSLLSFKADINRLYGIEAPRVINTDPTASPITSSDTTYNKYFTFDRYYAMHWDLSRSLNFDFSAVNYATVDEPYGLLNTKAKRDTLSRNFWKGGRTTNYQQTAAMRYIFPLNKLPLTDWVTASYTYGTSYNWIGASRLAITLGNTLENSQTNTFASDFDFTKLYAKSRWLKPLNTMPKPANTAGRNTGKAANTGKLNTAAPGQGVPLPSNGIAPPLPSREEVITDKYGNKLTGKKKRQALQKWRQQKRDFRLAERLRKANQTPELKGVMRAGAMLLTMVKHVGVSYSEDYQSTVPGFMDSTQFLGQDWKTMQPGLDYIFGKQPDTSWLNKKAAKGFMTNDSSFNSYYAQNYAQKLSITAQLEPIRDMRIDVSFDKSFSKNYSELFKDTLFYNNSNLKEHLNPLASGGFSVSWIGIQTLFRKSDPNRVSDIFQKFEDNRIIVSNRLASQNPYWTQSPAYTTDGYAKGYGRYSQDVLIPAFLAAYTGKSPYTIALVKESSSNIKSNPFGGYLPKPNWRLSYSGLNRIPALAKIFSAINITNAYSGILSMNSYTSSLTYSDVSKYGSPGFIDTVSGNYVPFYVVPNVSIQEQFSPLIGVEATTVKQWSFKFVYNKSRQLSLSLVDYQMSETNSKEWIFGFGWRKRGIRLPFKIPGMQGKKLQNDLSLKLDISLRDDATGNSTLDQTTAYATSGQKVFSLQPSVDYVLNNRINLKLYFTRLKTTPYISTTAPTVSTTAGLQVRISLAP